MSTLLEIAEAVGNAFKLLYDPIAGVTGFAQQLGLIDPPTAPTSAPTSGSLRDLMVPGGSPGGSPNSITGALDILQGTPGAGGSAGRPDWWADITAPTGAGTGAGSNSLTRSAPIWGQTIPAGQEWRYGLSGVTSAASGYDSSSGGTGTIGSATGPMGTEAQFAEITRIAERFGLVMTSGLRPGAGTPSGNRSYHASGEAGDFGVPGGGRNDPRMLAFAEYMRQHYGSQLEELIYHGPGFSGRQINDGQTVPDSVYAGSGDHTDHVHVAVKDMIDAARPKAGDLGRPFTGPTPVVVDSFGSGATSTLSGAMGGLGLDQDLGLSRGLPGLVENLFKGMFSGLLAPLNAQFAGQPSGGLLGMVQQQNVAAGRSPLLGRPMPALSPLSPTGIPGLTPGLAASPLSPAMPGPFGAPTGPPPGPAQYGQPPQGQWQPSGGGFAGLGGAPMGAISGAASAAANAFAPGSGAGVQMGMELLNRTVGYGGQVAGIAAGGLLETFGLSGSALGDPSQSWIGKVLSGFAGARPAEAPTAGKTETPVKPETNAGQKAQEAFGNNNHGGPTVHIEHFTQAENRNGQQAAQDLAFRAYQSAGGR
ncbi:MAG: hypothetical protein WBB00_07915 [Mycobacterium sp.]